MNALLLLSVIVAADPVPEAIELKTKTGTIYGGIDLPEGKGPWPIVILHGGSGPTDRDGNNPQMKMNSLKLIGQALREKGFAVLRFDKRGIAASAKSLGKIEELKIDTYADDVVEWVKLLRADKRFSKVAFMGHSEGSMIGAIAAKSTKFDAFISLCGPGRPFDVLLIEQISKDGKEYGDKSAEILKAIGKGEEPKDVPKVLAALFNKSIQPYIRSCMAHDPAQEIAAIPCPTLIVSGSTDIQVAEADFNALVQAKPKAKSVRLKNMNHVLKEFEKTNKFLQLTTYMNPDLPLHPQLAPALVSFLTESLAAK
ncbi:MAG: alpha/beta hydrolase [Gemmataceae bacterium]